MIQAVVSGSFLAWMRFASATQRCALYGKIIARRVAGLGNFELDVSPVPRKHPSEW